MKIENFRSPSLRGSHHSEVPSITNQPLNTLLPLTKDQVPHPQPFYVTQVIDEHGWGIWEQRDFQGWKLLSCSQVKSLVKEVTLLLIGSLFSCS